MDPSDQTKASFVIQCNGIDYVSTDHTTIHMMKLEQDKFCYSDYSCGNIKAWKGKLVLRAAIWLLTTFGSFLRTANFTNALSDDTQGINIYIRLDLGWEKVLRYCTKLSEPICFEEKCNESL